MRDIFGFGWGRLCLVGALGIFDAFGSVCVCSALFDLAKFGFENLGGED